MSANDPFKESLLRVAAGTPLSEAEAYEATSAIMDGQVSEPRIAAFLTALKVRGETSDELTGAARAMRQRVVPIAHNYDRLLDTCGTGGDGTHTFNVSTTVAFVCAAAGAKVAKHGNRAVSSSVGSADVLEALGAAIGLTPTDVLRCIDSLNVGFMFAPRHHGALAHAAPVRRELGFRTMFNLLGPMTNPAAATHQLMGIFDGRRLNQVAEVLMRLGVRRALVVHGPGGMDELGLDGPSHATLLVDGDLQALTIDPAPLGLAPASTAALKGGDAAFNAQMMREILGGRRAGAAADIVALNAGAALWVAELAESLADGVALARDLLQRGTPLDLAQAFVDLTRTLAEAYVSGAPADGRAQR